MAGGIYLAGGGSAIQEANVWDAMLIGVSRLLYWPVALSGEMLADAESWLLTSLGDRPGLRVTTWLDLAEHRGEDLGDFDLVFVGGGNTYDLLHRIRAAGLAEALRRFVQSGGAYYGGSAGAVVAGSDIGIARGYDENQHPGLDQRGLGLVPFVVLPHFTDTHVVRAIEWSRDNPSRRLVGIPEASGLLFAAHRATVLGPDPIETFIGGSHMGGYESGQVVAVS